jgi:hypothetical protein
MEMGDRNRTVDVSRGVVADLSLRVRNQRNLLWPVPVGTGYFVDSWRAPPLTTVVSRELTTVRTDVGWRTAPVGVPGTWWPPTVLG